MATVNKASLRAEFDALKARFEALCAAGKMPPRKSHPVRRPADAVRAADGGVHGKAHREEPRQLRPAPPRKSPDDATARTRPRYQGQGAPHRTRRALRTRAPGPTSPSCASMLCARCGEDLTDTACNTATSRRTLVDIEFVKVVRHADADIKHCPRCHTETRACFPDTMPRPAAVRPRRQGPTSCTCSLPRCSRSNAFAQSMHALIGQLLSEATLLGYLAQLHHALDEWERHAIERPPPRSGDARRRDLVASWAERITGFTSSATRQGWSRGIGVCDDFMKPYSSSRGCETRPAKGEPAPVGSEPCAGTGNGSGDA